MPELEQNDGGLPLVSSALIGTGSRDVSNRWETIPPVGWTSASVVHDLRNPLATISAGLEMLTGLDSAAPGPKRVIANMRGAAGRMRQLLTDLQDAALGNARAADITVAIFGLIQPLDCASWSSFHWRRPVSRIPRNPRPRREFEEVAVVSVKESMQDSVAVRGCRTAPLALICD